MNDTNDINALEGEELKAQAKILGVSLKGNPGDDTLRDRIRETLGEASPKDATAPEPTNGIAVRSGEKRYTIEIHKDGKDKQPVFLGCNGRTVRVQRGSKVTIGEGIYNSLKNAVESRYDTEAEEWVDVPSYPYTVLNVEG